MDKGNIGRINLHNFMEQSSLRAKYDCFILLKIDYSRGHKHTYGAV